MQNLEAIVKAADKVDDLGSSDMLATYIGKLEKQNWILDARASVSAKRCDLNHSYQHGQSCSKGCVKVQGGSFLAQASMDSPLTAIHKSQ